MTGVTGFGMRRVERALARLRPSKGPFIIGVTGAVAAGKSAFATALERAMAAKGERRVAVAGTDGFLLPNAVLEARGLAMRKGFPESYDTASLTAALRGVRRGAAVFPGYSHERYDVDETLARRIGPVDVLIIEGLGLPSDRAVSPPLLDALIYLDAAEVDLETWYIDRFVGLWRASAGRPGDFYARFAGMREADVRAFAHEVWQAINLPNLRQHICPVRDSADIVIAKRADHGLASISARRRPA